MIVDPEVRISGRLRESLEELRAMSDDRQLCALMDARQEHASFHTLVDTGVRGLEKYLTNDERGRIETRGSTVTETPRRSGPKKNGGKQKPRARETAEPGTSHSEAEHGLELAERSLAVIDATLLSVAQCPVYVSSLAVQEGLTHIRGRVHAAVENLGRHDHRGYLESLAESLCRELNLRSAHSGGH